MATRKTNAKRVQDKPSANATLANLDIESSPEPFIYRTFKGKEVIFPDPYDMGVEEAEDFLADFAPGSGGGSREILEKWVGEDNANLIFEDNLTFRQMVKVLGTIFSYYHASFGSVGESPA